jgi:hypothetical protein
METDGACRIARKLMMPEKNSRGRAPVHSGLTMQRKIAKSKATRRPASSPYNPFRRNPACRRSSDGRNGNDSPMDRADVSRILVFVRHVLHISLKNTGP